VSFRRQKKWGMIWKLLEQEKSTNQNTDKNNLSSRKNGPLQGFSEKNPEKIKFIERAYNLPPASQGFLSFLLFTHKYTLIPLGQLLKMALPVKELESMAVEHLLYRWNTGTHENEKTPPQETGSLKKKTAQKRNKKGGPPQSLSKKALIEQLSQKTLTEACCLWSPQPFFHEQKITRVEDCPSDLALQPYSEVKQEPCVNTRAFTLSPKLSRSQFKVYGPQEEILPTQQLPEEEKTEPAQKGPSLKQLTLSSDQESVRNFLLEKIDISFSSSTEDKRKEDKQPHGKKSPGGFSVTLLEGLTGSGKTEVYLSLIPYVLGRRQQILFLVPEISLIQPLAKRIESYFGKSPLVWHGSLGAKKRREALQEILLGSSLVLVGTRSSIFLPFTNLKGIIVDEEHDSSYKQSDSPCYQGRDMAITRGQKNQCPVILVSATPSFETLRNVALGRYGHIEIKKRHGQSLLPKIHIIDRNQFSLKGRQWLTPPLRDKLKENLEKGFQSLIFYNRRGYAPLYICQKCGDRPMCPQCAHWLTVHLKKKPSQKSKSPLKDQASEPSPSFSLSNQTFFEEKRDYQNQDPLLLLNHTSSPETLGEQPPSFFDQSFNQSTPQSPHQNKGHPSQGKNPTEEEKFCLQCHYCGFSKQAPERCESCHSQGFFIPWGVGVESLCEEVKTFLPQGRVGVCSSDLLPTAEKIQGFIQKVLDKEIDIIVGTQMMSKGHHFPLLTCVGVVEAEDFENPLDPRSSERLYQIITQVAGRSGREKIQGDVYIQTKNPHSTWVEAIQSNDASSFFQEELEKRAQIQFSPFARWAMITLKGKDDFIVHERAKTMGKFQPKAPGVTCLGPAPAPMNPLGGFYRWRFILKASKDAFIQHYIHQWIMALESYLNAQTKEKMTKNPTKSQLAERGLESYILEDFLNASPSSRKKKNPGKTFSEKQEKLSNWGLTIDIDPYDFL
jgi:primosomal protein N'